MTAEGQRARGDRAPKGRVPRSSDAHHHGLSELGMPWVTLSSWCLSDFPLLSLSVRFSLKLIEMQTKVA